MHRERAKQSDALRRSFDTIILAKQLSKLESYALSCLRQSGLGLLDNGLERCGLVDGEIRQHLAIDHEAGLRKAVNKSTVGEAKRAHGRVQALDPQGAEGALLALSVAVGVLRRLIHRLLGDADGILAAAVKALGGLEDFLVLGVSGHTALDASHD